MPAPTLAPAIDVLLARIYRHYPKGVESDDSRHRSSEESRRLACVQEAAARSCEWRFYAIPEDERVAIDPDVQDVVHALRAWRSFAARWGEESPDSILWDESNPWHDASYRYSALRPGYEHSSEEWRDPVVCAVSVLAPVYAIYTYVPVPGSRMEICYASFPDQYHDRIARLDALATEMFGFARLDEDVLLHPVSDVVPLASNLLVGEARLRDCLFSTCP